MMSDSSHRGFALKNGLLIFTGLFLFMTSCRKESDLGKDTLNQDDLLGSSQIDTFSLQTYTIAEDSVISDNPAYAVLGSMNDPKFGTVNANFYTQFRLSGLNPDFGDISTLFIDSIVLGLEYVGFTGDLSTQTFEVYELTESLHIDSTYYAFTTKNVASENLMKPGYESIQPDPQGVTVIGEDTVDTQLRLRLKNSFAKRLILEANSSSGTFATNEAFLAYFKGLHVRVNNGAQPSGKGGVFYFNLNDPLSKMTIYYKQSGLPKTFDFLINTSCADFNHVEIDNTGKPVNQVISDTVSGQKEFYAQAFRSRAVVDLPGLANIPKTAVIHRAELILPTQYQLGSEYIPSTELLVAAKVDGKLSGIGVYGLYDYAQKQYFVDIRNFVQAYVSGKYDKTTLYLSPRFFITSAERVVFNGPLTNNKMKPKLLITYTTF
jgi:hypothetical protein